MRLSGKILLAVLFFMALSAGAQSSMEICKPIIGGDPLPDLIYILMQKAYARLGITMDPCPMPVNRSVYHANAGGSDGELYRVAGLSARFPNLIQVSESIFDLKVVAISLDPTFTPDSWDALKGKRVAYISGFLYAKEKLEGMNPLALDHMSKGHELLLNHKIDVLIETEITMATFGQQLKGEKIYSRTIDRIRLYHYLHKRHKALASGLAEAIRNLKESPEYQSIIEEFYQRFQN